MGLKWTKREQSTLRRMAAAEACAYDIGQRLGRTRNAVISRANRTGVNLEPTYVRHLERTHEGLNARRRA